MNPAINKTTIDNIMPLFEKYLKTLNGVSDDYWEEHIINAEFYEITINEKSIGYFSVYNKEKITQFYMFDEYLNHSQPIFKKVLEKYKINSAYVSTSDQLFLSLCLDFHSKVFMQAYFFDGTVNVGVRPAEYGRDCLFEVDPNEFDDVKTKTGDFFDFVSKSLLEQGVIKLYKLCEDGEDLGYGIIVPNKLLTQYWANGMITLEKYRGRGVGRSIQMHLSDICKENGYIPISGCWYYNQISKKTIESAGRFSKTRLLNITF